MRNIQVRMGFTADTTQAQSAIQQLQNSLQSIATTKVNVQGGSIDQAVQSAKQLSQHLAAATNVNTGKIDFSALQSSLKAANTDLTTLTNNLLAMGPKGQQAFSQVANAVAHAELSVKKTNSALASFGVTLMNTIKWQAASSMIHGAMSAFSDAVQHIEKLDKALNDIQIVSGKTSNEMASFTKRAQELSKALSSTTEEYSKAALIFYQQGLGEKEVLDRTEATIKMAKVTGEAVATVSDQLTAIWNNFDNGTKSLEYYVDVITALGAATASSTDEISDGLQKFAAIAETVGLSYEYAATALATITSETRQSADVVGTALKTLFARMEGLKLGETLEDGTTLNQYSQAMAKVGINIKDANGNLKEMDTILDEMGAKWQTLNKDQQVALAQQVGGIRQYNQLIALMDNWDTFKINLEIAEDSEGTLDKQMAVYQTSIEASEKALQNAKETLYETLFNSEMLKDFNNGLTEVLEIINRIVESAGGLKGLLKFGGLLLLKTLLPHLQGFITNITAQISNVIGLTKQQKIKQVDTLSQTQKKISGQPTGQEERWRGISQSRDYHAQAAANHRGKTGVNLGSSRGDIMKANMHTAAAGVHDKLSSIMDSRIQGREQAIQDHRTKAAWGGAAAVVGKNGIERFAGAVSERWHTARANQMDDDARMSGVTPTSLGIKQSNMPAAPAQQSAIGATQMSTSDMASQISQESAGYTSAILDAKRDMLMVEDQLTEKQRQQYKNYEDQINAENDLLRIARERQLASKGQADEAAKAAETAVEMADDSGEGAASAAARKIKQKDPGLAAKKQQYDIQKGMIDKAESELGEESDDEDEATKKKRAALKDRRARLDRSTLGDANKAYTHEMDRLMTSPDIAKSIDVGGEATAEMASKMQKQATPAKGVEATVTQTAMSGMMDQLSAGDSGTPAVSVENLEKLGALQGQYNADAQIAVDLQGELGTAIGAVATSAKKGTKEYETGNKALKQSGTFAQKYGKEMKAAAKELQKAGELTEDQVKAVEDLVDAGADVELEGMDPKALEGVQKTLGKVEGGLTKAGAAAGQMADTMATDMAAATGATKDTFTAVTAGAQQLATDTANADQQANNLRNTMSQPLPVQPDPYGGLVMGAQGAMQAITGLAMGAQMLQTGLSMAFDPDATGIEKLTSLMMIMQGVQSLMTAAQGMYNVAVGVGNIIQAAAIVIREKGFGGWLKEIALKGVDTAATLVNAVAKVFNAEASKGLAGVIIGVLAAALIIGTIAMVANTVKTEQNTKKAQESADAKKEQAEGARAAAEAAREELDAVIELTDAYMDALKVYEETGEGKEELRQAAFDAIDAMGLEGHELEILAGNYANLTKKIKEYNAVKAGKAVSASANSLSSGGAAMLAMENVSGTGGLWTTEADGQKYLTMDLGDSGDDEGALDRWLKANEGNTPWARVGDHVRAPYTSSEDIPYLMKEFYKMYDGVAAIATDKELSDMEFFSEAQEMRDSGSWEYGQELASLYDTHTDTAITGAKATHLTGVDTQAGYNEAYDEMVEYALKARGLEEEIGKAYDKMNAEARGIIDTLQSNLQKDEEWSSFELKRRGLNAFDTKDGKYKDTAAAKYADDSSGQSALQKWAKDNGIDEDEALDLFLRINPQYYDSEDEIDEALKAMQSYLDANKIIVKYDLITGAKSALKETMSSTDWSNFYTQYEDLFDPNSDSYIGMTFKEFTEKSYSERQGILSSQQGNKVEALGDQITSEEKLLADMQDEEGWKEKYITTQQNELKDEYDQKVKDQIDEVTKTYSADQIKSFTDTGSNNYGTYLSEAIRWQNGIGTGEGQMTQAEYDEINKWATGKGWSSAYEYLNAKSEYLNTMNGVAGNNFGSEFAITNLEGFAQKTDAEWKAEAEAQYDSALEGQESKVQALKDEQHLASLADLDADITEFELDAETVYKQANAISEMAESSEELADSLKDDTVAAREVSKEIARYNKAIEEIESSYGDWSDALKSGNLSEQVEVAAELDKVYSNMLDLDFGQLSNEFLMNADNLELAKQAAEGSAEAYNKLQVLAAQDIYTKKIGELSEETLAAINRVANAEGIDVGEKIYVGKNSIANDLDAIYKEAYDAAIAGGASVAEAMAIANSLMESQGFNANIDMVETTVTGQLPTGFVPTPGTTYTDSNGVAHTGADWEPVPGETYTYTMMVPNFGSSKTTFTKSSEQYGGKKSDSSGGGSTKKAEPTKKSDVVERYKEINDKIADQEKAMDKASKAADRLWGPNRLQALNDANDALEKNIDLLKDKRAEAEYNLQQDKQALKDAISKNAGITVTDAMFDENGNFTSYNEVLNGLYDELKAEEDKAGSEWSESEQKRIEAIQERIDAVKEAIENYDETNTLIKDLDTEIQDAIYEWQDNNYEVLNVELEYELEINEKELEIVDYYLGKMEGDLYSYIEAMGQYNEQSAIYTDNLGQQEAYVNKLTEAYKKGEISEQAYKEGLASSQSAIISNLQSLEESKQAMQDYYGNVMEMAIEEIGIYTSEMEQLNSVLDHYSNIMEMVGKQDDFATKDKILTSKANNIKNELAVQSELYKRSSTEAEHWAKKMSEAVVGSNEYETYKKNWQAAQQAANEAQDAMLSKTEEWAEAMKAIVENELADFAATMEEQLTGGTSFDEMLTSMERRSSLQEEYLTTTNKIYETNKLMRTAQQEIDKTSNAAAKRRLQNFINETNQLQNQTKLSQYELDIQQAKYDLLLAEIALEEAQNAKSTVRLSRDSEGNFGYVYTADSAAVSEAEQNLADKQNALYNIGLEGANDYQQKYAETLQESQDAIIELTQMWMNGEIASEEEFNRRKQEIIEYYGEKLEQYSDLHSVALSADSRVVADAWSSDFTGMMATTGEWQAAVDGYFQSAAGSMQTWAQVCKETLATSGLNDVDGALKNIDDKSKALITTLLGEDGESGLVGAMMDQVDAASKISESQTTIQNAIDKTIDYFEDLLIAINNAYTAMTTPVTPAISTEGGTYNPDGSYTTSGNGTGNGSGNGSTGGSSGYDNQGYSEDKVKQAQGIVGASQDGKWGPKSQAAAKTYCGSTKIADVFKKWKDSLQVPKDDDTPTTPTPVAFDSNPVTANGLRYTGMGRPITPGFAPVAVAFDTGGYTGAWGSYGKLAVLHEKELVLNKQQTENMLHAMDLLDHILQMIDLQSASAQLGGILSSPYFGNMNTSALEQSVHIEASFPGVQDRNEIEEAFNNLINKASQYAHRK